MFRVTGGLILGGLAGKFIGFVRELLLAYLFGTSAPVSSIRIAQTATLVPVNFFCSDALNAVYIPLQKRYSETNQDRSHALFWVLFVCLCLMSIVISVSLFLYAGLWTRLVAPGLDTDAAAMASSFLQIMALGVPFYVIGALFSYLELSKGGCLLASIRPTLQSLGLIGGVLAAFWLNKLEFLAWGFFFSYLVFAFIGIWILSKKGYLEPPKKRLIGHVRPVLIQFWKTIRPLLLVPIMLQGSIVVERAVASLVGTDAVAALDYAKYITETGMVLLAVPLGLAGLSAFSTLGRKELEMRLVNIMSLILIISVPVSAFLALHSEAVIRLLYGRGEFGESSITVTSDILLGLALGLWAQVAGYVLIKALNAQLKNKKVVLFMTVALCASMAVNLLLYKILGAVALGIAVSVYGFVLFVLGLWAFHLYGKLIRLAMLLIIGTVIYLMFDYFLRFYGLYEFYWAIFLFVCYWILFVCLVPEIRFKVIPIWDRLRRSGT